MASPHASSFICLPFGNENDVRRAYNVYYGVCLGSATIGTFGSLLFLCQVLCGTASKVISKSQKNVLVNLAIADFLADIGSLDYLSKGVIARSMYYLFYWERDDHVTETDFRQDIVPAIGGVIVESWVVFWYLATYFWTFFFAVDIYNSKHNGRWKLWCSHSVTWIYCLLLAVISLLALWACRPALECALDNYCIVGHFLCTFGPIFIFLVALPLFYLSTLQKMEQTFKESKMIEVQMREKKQAKKKIFIFIVVFYVCWLINVVDGILLIVSHLTSPPSFESHTSSFYQFLYKPYYIYSVWIIEAIVNPLQGLLNALAYGNACQGIAHCCTTIKNTLGHSDNEKIYSWSGEYIDVDFREGRGSIWSTKRKKALSC